MRSTEVTGLRWPRWPNRQCANSSLAMSWPDHVQILSFASMAPSQVAVKHDFVAKVAGGCSSYDVIAPWPDLTRSIFFLLPKIPQGLPHKVAENPAALRADVFSLSAKNLRGGCTNPPVRARVKIQYHHFRTIKLLKVNPGTQIRVSPPLSCDTEQSHYLIDPPPP